MADGQELMASRSRPLAVVTSRPPFVATSTAAAAIVGRHGLLLHASRNFEPPADGEQLAVPRTR